MIFALHEILIRFTEMLRTGTTKRILNLGSGDANKRAPEAITCMGSRDIEIKGGRALASQPSWLRCF